MPPDHRPSDRPRLAVLAAVVLAVVGCGPSGDDEPIEVFAASSLGPVLDEMAAAAPVTYRVSLAGSQVVEAQVRAGAPADLVLLADPDRAQALADDGLAPQPATLARNRLVLAVRIGADVRDPIDLTDPELRVILADGGVPLGDATRVALTELEASGRLGPGGAAAVLAGADSLEDSAASVMAKLLAGEADAAIVYASDVRAFPEVDAIALPGSPAVTYTLQVTSDDPSAVELAAWLVSDEARDVLRAAGLLVDD